MVEYALMLGGGTASKQVGSSLFLSASERALVTLKQNNDPLSPQDWITCVDLLDGVIYAVDDTFVSGDCYRIQLATGAQVDEIYISNIQRKHYFTEATEPFVRVNAAAGCGECERIDGGLQTTGLLIERVHRNADINNLRATRDIMPADNGLETWDGCEIYIDEGRRGAEIWDGDLWRPGVDRQLTPWTRPNIYGYTFEDDVLAAGLYASAGRPAIDRIRADLPDPAVIRFNFYADFNERPTMQIRKDSWMGPVNNTLTFNNVRVRDGATLTIQSGADLTFNGDLEVQAGSSIVIESGVTLTISGDLVAQGGASIMIEDGATLRFASGKRLIATGDVRVAGATLTEATSGQGWGGIYAASTGSVLLDSVLVINADIGLETRTSNWMTIKNSIFEGNGIGILGDYEFITGMRSNIQIFDSCVINSQFDPIEGFPGYGIWAKGSNVRIVNSTISGNDAYGLRFEQSDLTIAHGMLVAANGLAPLSLETDGMRVLDNGDLILSTGFYGEFPVGTERNSIHDNARHEISIEESGFATVGIACTSSGCPIENRVSEFNFPVDGDFLIENKPPSIIPAQEVFWATTPADPPPVAFLQPTLVDDLLALSSDPASDAGRPGGCPGTQGTRAGGGGGRISSAAPQVRRTATQGFNPDMAEAIREQILVLRTELARNPAADTAATLASSLYRLQRLDKEDELGEHTATMGLFGTLYAHLRDTAPLDTYLRATAEQAYTATLNDLMRHERYGEAEALLIEMGSRTDSEHAGHTSALTRIALDEIEGDYESAVTRIADLVASLGEEREQLARDLETRAALLNRRMAAQHAGGEQAEAQTYAIHISGEAETPLSFALSSAYPNPFNPQTTLTFSVADAARVEIIVYDVLGREISTLVNERLDAGRYETVFDGSSLASGMYLVRMTARPENGVGAHAFTKRITLLK